jgi:predicted  nucleic acid-binding Zn-ribbon protein
MFLPSFRHLIEIEALKKQNRENQLSIFGENKRILDLEARRKKTEIHSEELIQEEKKLKLHDTQQQVDLLQSRLSKLNSQLTLATSEKEEKAFENQIKSIRQEMESLETLYFSHLERSEAIQIEILENKEFMKGSLESLANIKAEVETIIQSEEKIIANRNLRINSLIDDLPKGLKTLYLELEKKLQLTTKRPISYLINKQCSDCHILLDSVLRSSLEEGRTIEICPSCDRLLIPETAKIY